MKKIAIAFLLVVVFAAPTIACPLPVDVKIHKITTNKSELEPAIGSVLETRLRGQLRAAFSCRGKQPADKTGNVVNIDLVEIIHEGVMSTRVNIATDRGFFSTRMGVGYMQRSPREQFEAALEQIAEDISATCK